MQTVSKTIITPPDSELGRTLKAARASGKPVRVDTGEEVYTLIVAQAEPTAEDVFAHDDPQRVLAALRESRGALAGVDTEQLLADLAAQRAQDDDGQPG